LGTGAPNMGPSDLKLGITQYYLK